jgi:hypothetical protein
LKGSLTVKSIGLIIIASILVLAILAGCSPAVSATTSPGQVTETPAQASTPQASSIPQVAPTSTNPPAVQGTPGLPRVGVTPVADLPAQIEQAKADLSARLKIEASSIQVVLAENVDWPDGSLGCPKPGIMYIQIVTPGVLIRLQYAGKVYEYHSGGNTKPFYCENGLNPTASP